MMYQSLCTEFYDLDKKFSLSDEINFYKQFLDKEMLVLEPMCGSGRLLIPLLQEDYLIHGVDSSTAMLKSCKERAANYGLDPTLFKESIETMALSSSYDRMLIPLGSFQLFYPRLIAFNALQNLKKHLKPNGKLILDLFVPWDALYENRQEEVTNKEVLLPHGGKIIHHSHNTVSKHKQSIYCNSSYKKIIDGQVIAEESEQMHICWYYRYEMELILEKQGFKNIVYREEHFSNEDHMIFIAENA